MLTTGAATMIAASTATVVDIVSMGLAFTRV
jgi:hypothetical protein